MTKVIKSCSNEYAQIVRPRDFHVRITVGGYTLRAQPSELTTARHAACTPRVHAEGMVFLGDTPTTIPVKCQTATLMIAI